MRLGHLVHRITPIDDRSELAHLDEPLQEQDIITPASTDRGVHPFAADEPRGDPPGQRVEVEAPAVGSDVEPAGLERAPAPAERELADGVDDRVVPLAVPGEVLLRVVDDLVGAEGTDELDVPRAADTPSSIRRTSGRP